MGVKKGNGGRLLRLSMRLALTGVLSLVLTGCLSYRYIPKGGEAIPDVAAPAGLAAFKYTYQDSPKELVTGMQMKGYQELVDSASQTEFDRWFEGRGDDISASLSTKTVSSKGTWTILPYLLTLTLIPSILTSESQTTLTLLSGDTKLYEHTETFGTKSYLSVYFPTPMFLGSGRHKAMRSILDDQFARHKLALGKHIADSRATYEQAVAADTVSGYREFVKNNPDSFFRMESLSRLAKLEPEHKALAFHRDNLNVDPAYLTYLPDRFDIWFIGPDGVHVYDVLRLSRTEDEALLAARIKAAGQPYKVFNSDEVSILREGGLSSALITAMIEASGQASVAGGATEATSVVPVASAVPGAAEVPGKPGAGDVAAQCTKRLLAMKACDQIPSFGANICRSQVAKKYSHVACSLIN